MQNDQQVTEKLKHASKLKNRVHVLLFSAFLLNVRKFASNLAEPVGNKNRLYLSSILNVFEMTAVKSAFSFRKHFNYQASPGIFWWLFCQQSFLIGCHTEVIVLPLGIVLLMALFFGRKKSGQHMCCNSITHSCVQVKVPRQSHCPDLEISGNSLQYTCSFLISNIWTIFVSNSKWLLCYVDFWLQNLMAN